MTFPQTPLDARSELQIGGTWTDASADVYTRDPITITRGAPDEATGLEPSTCSLTLNNRDGRYSPQNPMSPYYGLIGRNTPLRVSVQGPESYLSLEGSTTSYARTPDAAALDITGDIDLRVEATVDWYSTASQALLGKWISATNQRSYLLRLLDGVLILNWSATGAVSLVAQQPLPLIPKRATVRATLDVDNGSGSYVATFYWAESMTGPWIQIGDPLTGTASSIFASTASLEIAPIAATGVLPVAGRVHRAEVRNGIGGTVVASPDIRPLAEGSTGWTDSAGRVWTLGADAEISDRQYRFHGEISAWPSRWDVSGKDVYVPVEAAGVTRRMGQGKKALDSTLRRRIVSDPNLIAYWPMEDGAEATAAYSPLPGVTPLNVTGFDFAADDSLGGASALPRLGSPSSMRGAVPQSTASGWQVEYVYLLPVLPAVETEIVRVTVVGSAMKVAVVSASTAGVRIEAQASDGTVLAFFTYTHPPALADFAGTWNRLAIYTGNEGGGTTRLYASWRDIAADSRWNATTLFTGTQGAVQSIEGAWGSGTADMVIGHLAVFDIPAATTGAAARPGSTIFSGADDGFNGETVLERLGRLAIEEAAQVDLSWRGEDYTTPSERMGPQRPGTLLDLIEEAAAADGGVLYEHANRTGLVYRDRQSLYNQRTGLALSYTAEGEVPPPLEPTEDDQRVRNDVTVTRLGGSSGRSVAVTGPLSSQPPPAGVGIYDESITLALYSDGQPEQIAAWRVHLGTWDEARYPTIMLWLHAAPHLIDNILELDIGDRLTISDLPPWLPPGLIDQHMRGYTEILDLYEWTIAANCAPAGPWEVGVRDDAARGKRDTAGSQLAAAATSSATTLSVATTSGPLWVTAAPNTLTDPGFETGTGAWACTRGASIGVVSHETGIVHAGAGALRVTRVHLTDAGTMNLWDPTSVMTAAVGQTWAGSAWVYSGGSAANNMRVALVWRDSGGTDTFIYGTAPSVGPGVWTRLTVSATLPAGAVSVRLGVEGRSAWTVGEWWLCDEVRLARTDTLVGPDQGDQFPFEAAVGGEVVNVHGISGTSSPQTFHVDRSRNAIVKPQTAATAIRLARPTVRAL